MWWKTTSRRSRNAARSGGQTPLDEAFLRRLERLSINASRSLRGGLSGSHPSLRRLPAPTVSDHRPYAASDDLRYIDWNAYARQEHLHVKLGETEQDVPVHVLLDRSRSMEYGVGDQHKLHYGRMLLAALGYLALASGDKLTAATLDTAPPWGPSQTKAQAVSLLRYAGALAADGSGDWTSALLQYTRPRTGGLLIVLSDLYAAGDLDQLLRSIGRPRWQVLLLHILHPHEIDPPLRGELELEDSESDDHLPLHIDTATIDRYRQRLNQWCGAIETACGRRGASYARLTTDMPIERAVIPFLRERQLLNG
jgi:uncharacterized protein (DUF58 family)